MTSTQHISYHRENALPAICGQVCPQEDQCGGVPFVVSRRTSWNWPIMERFVADYHMAKGDASEPVVGKNGIKVAVIGCGPSGITCAGELARRGYEVTVLKHFGQGGVLVYGIPEFRLLSH